VIAGADGRSSMCRSCGHFESIRGNRGMLLAGILFDGIRTAEDTSVMLVNFAIGQVAYFFPQHSGRVRAYCALPTGSGRHLQGASDVAAFIYESIRSGAPSDAYKDATPVGPLATFDSTANWVEEVYCDGIALVGDAAGTSDPVWGQGLSLTLRDAKVLSEHLLASRDWDAAGRAYAEEHKKYFSTQHTVENWFSELFIHMGPDAAAARGQALPLILEDPSRIPDHIFSGPELPCNEQIRRRLFGEE
jgi:menaquinone-9 beta-reductase